MFGYLLLQTSVVTYQKIRKDLHHLKRKINIRSPDLRQHFVDRFCSKILRLNTVGRIKMRRILPCIIHQHADKLFFKKCVGNSSLFCHFIYIWVTGRIQDIMAAKSQHICHQCRIFFPSDTFHSSFKKISGFSAVHPYSVLSDRIL